ncbi:MAG: hypothetical protein WC644_06010 [Ignavibacteria bacterium]
MKTLAKSLVACVILLFLFLLTDAYSQQSVYGEQTKGTSGKNAELNCDGISLSSTATIVKVTGSNDGFWIADSYGVLVQNFSSMEEAIGYQLKKGTYFVYPNLKSNQNKASVKVTFN